MSSSQQAYEKNIISSFTDGRIGLKNKKDICQGHIIK